MTGHGGWPRLPFAFAVAAAVGGSERADFESRLRNLFLSPRDIPFDGRAVEPMTLMSAGTAGVVASFDSEAALISRARGMEAAAWDQLYTAHYSAIYRYVAFRVFEPEAAEDLAAEVFLEAVRGIGRYHYRGTPFRAWLYRLAHNLTADERRRRLRRGLLEAPVPERESASAAPDFAAAADLRRDLRAALVQLTEDQQQVIILRFLEDLSLAEVGAVMKRPTGAIKSLQHRAVLRLRALIDGEVV